MLLTDTEIIRSARLTNSFNGHPPLGVNATVEPFECLYKVVEFQWAPTLGGECYLIYWIDEARDYLFQWAPTLGGECYSI